MKYTYLCLSIVLLLSSKIAVAQTAEDTTIKGSTIEIIQSYKPEVKQSAKPALTPALPPLDTSKPNFRYDVPPQKLNYTYSPLPLQPLALTKNNSQQPFANYVKLGGGNLSTIFLDAGIGSLQGENYKTAIHLQHLSQKGNIAGQQTSLTGMEAEGTYYKGDNAINVGVGISRNQYYYYGYDHTVYAYDTDSLKQAFTGIHIDLGLANNQMGIKRISYQPTISFDSYSDSRNASETSIGLNAPFQYEVDSTLQLFAGIYVETNQFKNSLTSQSSNIIQFRPGINLHTNSFDLRAGINPTFGQNSSTYMLPDIEASFRVPNTQFLLNVGWQAKLLANNYRSLSGINPYMSNSFTVQQTTTNEVFAEIKSNISNNLSFSGRASWWEYNGLPLFVNDTLTDNKRFNILYDSKINNLSLQASIRYQIAHTFTLGFNGRWNNFYKHSFVEVWHMPGIEFGADVAASPIKHLTITGYLSVKDELYALDKNNKKVKLNTIIDLGVGAEYEFIKRLSAFVNAYNLLNSGYQRWYGYDAYGMNVYGGIQLKF
ncbi:MAG: hypothetical protein R2800_00075 [Flavipsychrobacter sp.]